MRIAFSRVYRALFVTAICALTACSGNPGSPGMSGQGFTPAISPAATTVTVKTIKGKAIVKNVPVRLLRCLSTSPFDCALGSAKYKELAKGTTNARGIAKLSAAFSSSQLICAEGVVKVGTSTSSVRNCVQPFPKTIEVDFQ